MRHHRKEKRFGPSPKNNYTSGSGKTASSGGFLGRFRRGGKTSTVPEDEAGLPQHTQPDQLNGRQSYATETTAVNAPAVGQAYGGDNNGAYKKHEPAYELQQPHQQQAGVDYGYNNHGQHQQPHNYRYEDGVYPRVTTP